MVIFTSFSVRFPSQILASGLGKPRKTSINKEGGVNYDKESDQLSGALGKSTLE